MSFIWNCRNCIRMCRMSTKFWASMKCGRTFSSYRTIGKSWWLTKRFWWIIWRWFSIRWGFVWQIFSVSLEYQLSVCWIAGRQENKLQKVNFRSKVSATEELHGSNWFQLRRFSQHSFFIFRKSKETFRRTGKLQDGPEIQKNRFSFDEFHYRRFPFTPKSNSSVFTENFHRFYRELQWENFRDCPRANFEVLQQYVLLFLQMWSAEFDHLRIDWALYTRWVFWGLEIVIK